MTTMKYLDGKKTYIVSSVGAILTGLLLAGIIDAETWAALFALTGAGSVAALRHGIEKIEKEDTE